MYICLCVSMCDVDEWYMIDIDHGNCIYECILMYMELIHVLWLMDMLYGQGHKYVKYENGNCVHCIWLIKGLLTVYASHWYNGYGYGHGVSIAYGRCHLFFFNEPSGYVIARPMGHRPLGRTTVILSLGQWTSVGSCSKIINGNEHVAL